MKIASTPALSTIQVLRGIVDFYCWKGIAVARAWPRNPVQPNSTEQLRARAATKAVWLLLQSAPSSYRDAWQSARSQPGRAWTDLYLNSLMWTANRFPLPSPPDVVATMFAQNDPPTPSRVTLTIGPCGPGDFASLVFSFKDAEDTPTQPVLVNFVTHVQPRTSPAGLFVDRQGAIKTLIQPRYNDFADIPPLDVWYSPGTLDIFFTTTAHEILLAYRPVTAPPRSVMIPPWYISSFP